MKLDFILSKEEEKPAGKTELIYDLAIIGGGAGRDDRCRVRCS
ncbi:hypothetical protein ES703_118179 [subsurface metagenome]